MLWLHLSRNYLVQGQSARENENPSTIQGGRIVDAFSSFSFLLTLILV